MPAFESLLWQVIQGLNLALVPAIFVYLLWRRDWTWTGLYIAICCAGAGWAQLNTLATVLGSADTAQRALASGAAMRAALFLGAAISALRKPGAASTFMVLGTCLFLGYTGANALYRDLFSLDPAGSYAIGGKMVPDWTGLPVMVLFALGPCLIGLPWTLARQSNLQDSLVSAAHERYAIVFGLGIAAFVIVSCGMLAWAYVGHGPFSGERLQPALALETNGLGAANLAVWVIMGAGMFVFWAFPRHFIEQAAKLIEASERTDIEKLADVAPPMWRSLAESLDQSREEARRNSREAEEARAQLSGFFENAPIAMTLGALDGRIIMANRAVAEAYGRDVAHLPAMEPTEIQRFWPDSAALVGAVMQVHATGQPQRLTTTFKASDDAPDILYDVVVFPIRSSDGEIIQIGSLGVDITERKRAEAALAEREAMLAGIFDHAPVAITVFSRERRMVAANRAATGAYGMTRVGKRSIPVERFRPFWPEFDKFVELGLSVFETGQPQNFDIAFNPPRGAPQEIKQAVYFPIYSSTGEVAQVGLFMTDVTEQRRSQEELARSRVTLQAFFDNLPGMGFIVSREGNYVAANSYMADMLQLDQLRPENLIGAPDGSVGPAEWLELTRQANKAVLEHGKTFETEASFEMPDGKRHVFASRFPIRDVDGNITHIGGLMFDRTAEKENEAKVAESSATLQAFFENLPAMTFIISLDRKYVSANSFAVDHYGFDFLSPENLIGNSDLTGTPPEWHDVIAEAHRTVVEDGKPYNNETAIDLPSGHYDLQVSRFPIRNASGVTTHVGGLIFDRSAEKRAEAEIAASRESLHQSEKLAALGQLLAGVAHELNNPLTVVVGRSAILEEKLKGTPHEKAIAAMREAADRCNRIVKTFLAMARQSAPRRGAVQVNDAIEAALDMVAYNLRSAGIDLVRKFDQALPEVEADEDQLVQVFTNLMINAGHALEGRGEGIRLTITTGVEAGSVVAEFIDNGPGIPPDIAGRIFEPFFTTKAVGEGTGMGLAMSRGMIEEHGGSLSYADAPGGGAVFTVSLPIGDGAQSRPVSDGMAISAAKAKGKVLVVDDESAIRTMLVEVLELAELDCVECTNGAEALDAIANGAFDLVFCDVRMPVMDGVRFRQEIAKHYPHLLDRLIFISGDVLQRSAERYAAIADHPFIEKPFNPREVHQLALGMLAVEGEKP